MYSIVGDGGLVRAAYRGATLERHTSGETKGTHFGDPAVRLYAPMSYPWSVSSHGQAESSEPDDQLPSPR